jgi:uncharacterized protein (TIGR02996 family)
MTQELSFLEAIRRRPGSRAERLVYTDWLIDRGDARGTFMQLQCQAQRLSRNSPRRLALEAEAHDLLFRHEAEWLGPMLGVIDNWEWRGGMLESVTVTTEVFLANADNWLPALPILGVHLRKAQQLADPRVDPGAASPLRHSFRGRRTDGAADDHRERLAPADW